MISLHYNDTEFPAYMARPEGKVKGGIIVIHEVWALTDHTKSTADRYAAEGYITLAPNLLTMTNIAEYADTLSLDLFNPEKRNEAQPKLRALMVPMQTQEFVDDTLGKLQVCFDHLYNMPEVNENVAVTGFCFGGGYSYTLAMHEPRLKAAVPFYGRSVSDIDVLRGIKCPVLAFYGETDDALVTQVPELRAKMKEAGVDYEAVIYPGCGHAFFNDANPYAYNESAAQDAWQRTLSFLQQHIN